MKIKKSIMKSIIGITLVWHFFIVPIANAATPSSENFSWFAIFIGIAGGLAFFLYGMEKMSEGMKDAAGDQMRAILGSLTRNRFIGLFVGAFVTMIIQSSSATTVMLVSFVQAGLLNLTQSMGVILGADIGTTITAQMVAFKLTDYALLMVGIGFFLQLLGKTDKIKNIGSIIMGFGVLFFGMKLMSDVMKPLRTYPAFISLMQNMENPFMGILVGAGFTALVQSSSATTGVLIVLAQQGLISLEAGIPILFGANVGTCVTAALAGIGATREAKRVAIAHVLFKIAGVCLFIFWIPQFADIVQSIAEKFGSGTARQLANAHTIFNISIGVIFLPFISSFSKLIYIILPEKEQTKGLEIVTHHLDTTMISTPSIAINLARAEISRMAKILHRMLNAIIIPFVSDEKFVSQQIEEDAEAKLLIDEIPTQDAYFEELTIIEGIELRENKINFLDTKITDYLTRMARKNSSKKLTDELFGMVSIVKDMESMGDIIHHAMLPLIDKKHALEHDFTNKGKTELLIYQSKVVKQLQRLEQVFLSMDAKLANTIIEKEKEYLELEVNYKEKHIKRVIKDKQKSVETDAVHVELMNFMKQILVYSANIAKTYIKSQSEEKNSLDKSAGANEKKKKASKKKGKK